MSQCLHIISHTIPYPPHTGAVMDTFYTIKTLYELGLQIQLHCYIYDAEPSDELAKYCQTVTYYRRTKRLSIHLPFIVSSRINSTLKKNLLKDDYPILCEGIHTSFFVGDKAFKNREILIRALTIEQQYYHSLYKMATSLFKKIYFLIESILIKKYEQKMLQQNITIACIGKSDQIFFHSNKNKAIIEYLPGFLSVDEVTSQLGKGSYCLFQGDLSVEENIFSVNWLLTHIFKDSLHQLIIAGKNPSKLLQRKATDSISIIANPDHKKMESLLANAQVILIPTFTTTGLKIKVVQSLYKGRHCLGNQNAGLGFESSTLLVSADQPLQFKEKLDMLMNLEFTAEDIASRASLLHKEFDKITNANRLLKLLHLHYPAQRPQ
jgi:hypothetical protein